MNIDDADFLKLRTFVQNNYGINLEKKRVLVEGRLGNHIVQQGYSGFHDYVEDVLNDVSGGKVNDLLTRLTTNFTYFMREEQHYNFLSRVALPEWTSKIKNRDLRIWSAGCASGEEAYTAAIVINEYFGASKNGWDTTILATDISNKVLSIAHKGIYPESNLERLPEAWKKKYFTKLPDGQYEISPGIAKEVVFGRFNLMDDFSQFRKNFHIIFCRNVMIYFNSQTKSKLAKQFYNVLEEGGYLFIGLSETLSGVSDLFEPVAPAIYRKGPK